MWRSPITREGIKVSHERRVEKGHHRREKRLVWAVPVSELGILRNFALLGPMALNALNLEKTQSAIAPTPLIP